MDHFPSGAPSCGGFQSPELQPLDRESSAPPSLTRRFILRIWIADAEIKLAYEHVDK